MSACLDLMHFIVSHGTQLINTLCILYITYCNLCIYASLISFFVFLSLLLRSSYFPGRWDFQFLPAAGPSIYARCTKTFSRCQFIFGQPSCSWPADFYCTITQPADNRSCTFIQSKLYSSTYADCSSCTCSFAEHSNKTPPHQFHLFPRNPPRCR